MKKQSFRISVMFMLLAYHYIPISSIPCLGYDRSFAVKQTHQMIQEHYVLKKNIGKGRAYILSAAGLRYLNSYCGNRAEEIYAATSDFHCSHKKNIKENLRTLKSQQVNAFLNVVVPELPYQIIEDACEAAGISPLSYFLGHAILRREPDLYETMRKFAEEKKQQNKNLNFAILRSELRTICPEKVRNLAFVRASGMLHLQGTDYFLYNFSGGCMKQSSGAEFKLTTFYSGCCSGLNKGRPSAIIFAKNYQPLEKYLNMPSKHRGLVMMGKNFVAYRLQYYIPLTQDGSKQLYLFSIPGIQTILRKFFISNSDDERASNSIADGITDNGSVILLGFACEICKIEQYYDLLHSLWAKHKIIVFCFSWQAAFYDSLFSFTDHEVEVLEYQSLVEAYPAYFPIRHENPFKYFTNIGVGKEMTETPDKI